jgi:hypothetical protein
VEREFQRRVAEYNNSNGDHQDLLAKRAEEMSRTVSESTHPPASL